MAGPHPRPLDAKRLQPSIYRHGFEFVADRIKTATRAGKMVTVLASRTDGKVRYRSHLSDEQLIALASGADYIGTFSENDRIECIEDDLLHWMRSAP